MVTVNTHKNGLNPFWDCRGKSTDTKPVQNVPNGSTYVEVDTGKKYIFDGTAGEWNEVDSSIIISAAGVSF